MNYKEIIEAEIVRLIEREKEEYVRGGDGGAIALVIRELKSILKGKGLLEGANNE